MKNKLLIYLVLLMFLIVSSMNVFGDFENVYNVITSGDNNPVGWGTTSNDRVWTGQIFRFNGTSGATMYNATFNVTALSNGGVTPCFAYVVGVNSSGMPDINGIIYATSSQLNGCNVLGLKTFNFTTGLSLTNGNNYTILINSTASFIASTSSRIQMSTSDVYSNGKMCSQPSFTGVVACYNTIDLYGIIYTQKIEATNFTITNINNYNNQTINNFSAIINGTQYNTTTGTLTTPFLSNSTTLKNITIISNNMFNKTYLNQNISTSLIARQDQFPILFVKNVWNQSNVSFFNVSNGGFYNSSNGLIYVFANASTNVLVQSNNYFSLNTTLSLLQNTIQSVNLSQSIINFTVKELFTNNTVSNFSINISGYGVVCNTSTSVCPLVYPNNGTYTGQVIDNKGQDDYHTTSATFNVSFLDNKTVTLFVHQHYLNVFARDIQSNASINVFTANVKSLNISDDRDLTASAGNVTFQVIHNTYNVTIVSAPGYAFLNNDGTYNLTQAIAITSDRNVTFYLYRYNSINFTFFSVDSPSTPLTTVNISLGLVYSNNSLNYSTESGSIFAENLTAGSWEARYEASGYNPNNYFFSILESSTQRIRLYLQNDSVTTLFKILLRDQNDGVVSNNVIRLQKQFETLGGQFVTIRECKTNEIGVCYMYIQEGIDTSYRFVVINSEGDMIKTTEASPIVTLASEDKIITIRVDTGANLIEPMQRLINVYGLITLSNNVSTFNFIDGENAIVGGCLEVTQRLYGSNVYNTIYYSCLPGTSGTIVFNYSAYLLNDSTFTFKGYANYTDSQTPIYTISNENRVPKNNVSEDDNLFFMALFFIFIAFMMMWVPNLYIQILVDFGCMIGVVAMGFTLIGIPVIMSFMALGIFIHFDRKSARGYN